MIGLQRIFAVTIFVASSVCATYSQAYWQFTYTSDELPWVAGYLGGEPSDIVGTREPPYPRFHAIFKSEATLVNSGPTTFELDPAYVAVLWPNDEVVENFVVQTPSFITLDSDGSVLDWEFSLRFFYRGVAPDEPPYEQLIEFDSGNGGVDHFKYKVDIYNQRPFNTWEYVNTVEVHQQAASNVDNWVIEKIDVPEPHPLMLLIAGLGTLLLGRSRVNSQGNIR